MTNDLEGFVGWLRSLDTPEPNVEVYRRGAEVLAGYNDLEAALRSEEAAGASPRRLANLRLVAEQLRAFEESRRPGPDPELELAVVRERPKPALDVAPVARERSAPVTRREVRPPRKGCTCREHHDAYVDNDFGMWGKAAGGLAGIFGLVLARMVGIIGALCVALSLAGIGGLATTMSVCWRCESCRRPIRDLDADEKADLWRARGMLLLITGGLLAGAAVCALVWWSAMQSRAGD